MFPESVALPNVAVPAATKSPPPMSPAVLSDSVLVVRAKPPFVNSAPPRPSDAFPASQPNVAGRFARESESEFLSAREAAAMLGVKLPTVYAYTSRGLIQSMNPSAKAKLAAVLTVYMMAGPAAMRTARVSFVARLMRSPVRVGP